MKSFLESRLSVWFLCKEEWEGGLLKGSCLCQRISLIFSQIKEVPFGVHTLAYTRKEGTLSLELDHVINSILPQSKTACLGIRLWRARNQVRSWPVIPRNWKALWARGVVPVLKKWRTSNPPGSFLRPLFCPDSLAWSDGILHKPIPLLGTTHSLSLNVQGSLRPQGDLECTPHFSHKVEERSWSKPVHKKKKTALKFMVAVKELQNLSATCDVAFAAVKSQCSITDILYSTWQLFFHFCVVISV